MKKYILTSISSLAIVTAALAGQSPSLNAPMMDSAFDNWRNGDCATGNWGGFRDTLAEHGIEPFLYYTNIMSGNPVGGKKEGGFTYVDDFYFGLKLHLEKLVGWQGATLTVSGVNRDGRGLTANYVGSQYDSQQTVGGQNIFLYQLFLEQKFLDDKVSLKIGRFGASDDFNASPIYGYACNNGIDGDIRNVLFDTQFSAYPFATWAARLRIDPTPEFNAQVGIYQTWDRIFDRSLNGLDWGFHSNDGIILMAQVAWTPELFKRPVGGASKADGKSVAAAETKGYPGHYWIGGTYSPWKGYSQFGNTEKTGGSYGFYAHADQMVYQETPGSDQGLTVWTASGLYPQENISIIPFQVNGGLLYKGLFPTRDKDHTFLAAIYGNFSRDYAQTVELQDNGNPSHEIVIEAAHRFQVTKFAFVEPDIQWIINPAGTGKIPNALVIGVEMGVTF